MSMYTAYVSALSHLALWTLSSDLDAQKLLTEEQKDNSHKQGSVSAHSDCSFAGMNMT